MNVERPTDQPTTFQEQQAQLLSFAKEQGRQLTALQQEVDHLQPRPSSGGTPWTFMVLVGGAYVLYRRNPTVQEQISSLAKRIPPGTRDTLNRAANAAKGVLQKLDPRNSAPYPGTGSEWRREGELPLDHATSRSDPLKDKVIDRLQHNQEAADDT